MMYESINRGRGITLNNGRLGFTHNKSTGLGELDTASAALQARFGMTELELNKLIEADADFIRSVPGKSGIWLASKRLSAVAQGEQTKGLQAAMQAFDDKSLRAVLAAKGWDIPVAAEREDLIKLAVRAHIEPAPGEAVAAPEASAAAADEPPKKKRHK